MHQAGVTRAQVISALLDLVTIDEEGRPTKRRAVLDELSRTMVDELDPFVDARLLSTEAEGERTVVGVAHESFLMNWRPLKDEIDAQAAALRARRVVENAANDWVASGATTADAAARRPTRQGSGGYRRRTRAGAPQRRGPLRAKLRWR